MGKELAPWPETWSLDLGRGFEASASTGKNQDKTLLGQKQRPERGGRMPRLRPQVLATGAERSPEKSHRGGWGGWVMSPRGHSTAHYPVSSACSRKKPPHPAQGPCTCRERCREGWGASAREARLPREVPRAGRHPPAAVMSPHTAAATAPLRFSHASPGSTEGKYVNLTSIMAF